MTHPPYTVSDMKYADFKMHATRRRWSAVIVCVYKKDHRPTLSSFCVNYYNRPATTRILSYPPLIFANYNGYIQWSLMCYIFYQ